MLKINISTAAKVATVSCVAISTLSCGTSELQVKEGIAPVFHGAEISAANPPLLDDTFGSTLSSTDDGRRLKVLLERAAVQEKSIEIESADLFGTLEQLKDESEARQLNTFVDEERAQHGSVGTIQVQPAPSLDFEKLLESLATEKHNQLKERLDQSLSKPDAEFQSVAFGCLQDRRACSKFGYGYLDCELTTIMCFLEVVLD